jgi:hypothetical protein
LTASSNPHILGNIFEYSRVTWWLSNSEPNQWLLFDLKGLSFKIEKIAFDVCYGYIPRHWRLLASNNNQTWTTIHDQGNDERCIPFSDFVVDYDIQSSDFFTLFKFEQLNQNYLDTTFCSFYSVEFIGRFDSE